MQGFKDSKGKLPLHTVFTKQFPKALIEIAKRSEYGHQKYIEHDEDYMNFKRIPNALQEYKEARMRHNMCLGEDSETYLDHLIAATWCGLAEIELILDKSKDYAKRTGTTWNVWDYSRIGAVTFASPISEDLKNLINLHPLPTTNPTKMTEENLKKCKSDSTQKEELDEKYDFIEELNKIVNNSKTVEIPFVELTEEEFIEKYKPLTNNKGSIKFFSTYEDAVEEGGFANKNLWSLIQCPYDEMFIYPDHHSCDNIGYIIAEKEWEHENIQVDYNQNIDIEKAISTAQMFILTRGYKLNIVNLISTIIGRLDNFDKDKGYISIPRLYHATIDYIESITGEDLEDDVLESMRIYYYE